MATTPAEDPEPGLPPPKALCEQPRRRRPCVLLSFSAARDRFLRGRFLSAGLRPFSVRLPSPAGTSTVVHLWAPPRSARRPVLLLHGFGASATWQWAPYLRSLLAAGLDPIVPDLLFFGASSSTVPDRSDTFQARTVKAAMDGMGVRRFAVVGVSYGGFVAYRLAAMYPEAVERVVLVSSGVCLEEGDLAAGLFPVADVGEAAELLVPRRPAEVRRLVKLHLRPAAAHHALLLPQGLHQCRDPLLIFVMGSDHLEEKAELLHALINDRKLSDLPKINQPTLIIWGEQDQVFPMELAHRLERHLGESSRLVVVKKTLGTRQSREVQGVCKSIIDYFRNRVQVIELGGKEVKPQCDGWKF
ncbi:2-hydroxy-6-oxononadienedioate/2-hydroxy-6-oxononatrienedioate hydrolase [Zea mays]|uniref:2-hydroxy-6-oxononadienedioate/2-hydroxy-6-oxononatrienedioate hydrolase n=1 Tax=Zea mays TaxID=4577 RepID=A0A3L6D783_MAIZE|nr:2-hydroxy-6-oxononadienedioate/2-hydroxy-6-oxononatrienedioate hydrolase [Zea mays]